MKKHKPNRCPLLEGLGIAECNAGYGGLGQGVKKRELEKRNRVKSICQKCPLWNEEEQVGRCVLDYPGKVSKANRKILELELKKWQGKEEE